MPLISSKRIGGIRFVRIGRWNVSISRSKLESRLNWYRFGAASVALASAVTMGALFGAALSEVAAMETGTSYSLIVSRAGHDYRDDFNLTLDDCRQAVDVAMGGDLPMNDGARCEAE